MKICDACGTTRANIQIGSAMVCRTCEPELSARIAATRAEKKMVNAINIAKQIFREQYAGKDINLKEFPEELFQRMMESATRQNLSMRDFILLAVSEKLEK